MGVITQERELVVSNAIREISHIATLPEITMKIVELVEDPKSTAQDLHKVIANDPALCSRILKVVNSSFYGLPGQIGSINRAIVMLGLNAVKNIAIAASLAKLFRGGELTTNFSAKDLWTHSNITAAAAKMVANTLKLGLSDEAFLAGLIHDIGLMVEMQFDRNKLIDVFRRVGADSSGVPANDMLEAELAVFEATHQDFGSGLCEKWKFPKSFGLVTGHHHRPMELPAEHRTLSCIIYVADRLAADTGQGFRQDLVNTQVEAAVRDELKLTDAKINDMRTTLIANLKDLTALLG
ncbi:MAG: HDOD domain-containing protein [bacterium]|nr:HDOD domain-containing protein [bacterium]